MWSSLHVVQLRVDVCIAHAIHLLFLVLDGECKLLVLLDYGNMKMQCVYIHATPVYFAGQTCCALLFAVS